VSTGQNQGTFERARASTSTMASASLRVMASRLFPGHFLCRLAVRLIRRTPALQVFSSNLRCREPGRRVAPRAVPGDPSTAHSRLDIG